MEEKKRLTAQEKYDLIWNQICEKIKELNLPNMTLSKVHSEGWCYGASWYGENVLSDNDHLHVTPIEKCGRCVFGTIGFATDNMITQGRYKTYREFESILEDFLSCSKEEMIS